MIMEEPTWMKEIRAIIEKTLDDKCGDEFKYEYEVSWGINGTHLVMAQMKTRFITLRGHNDALLVFFVSRNNDPQIFDRIWVWGRRITFIKTYLMKEWDGRGRKPNWKNRDQWAS